MPKKQTTKQRTQVKSLPQKGKKLSAGDMKKVKGGMSAPSYDPAAEIRAPKKPLTTK